MALRHAAARSASLLSRAISDTAGLKERIEQVLPEHRERLKALRKEHGASVMGNVTVDQVIGGMRGVPGILYETSQLDAEEGIRLRGRTIQQLRSQLPKGENSTEPMTEGVLWLLLTGEVPGKKDAENLRQDLHRRRQACEDGAPGRAMESLPKGTHPMTRLAIGILAMQKQSKFDEAYSHGTVPKDKLWEPALEDCLNLISRLPSAVAHANLLDSNQEQQQHNLSPPNDLDWAKGMCHLLGNTRGDAVEYLRLYMLAHCDHEGGNVSAHACHLVGSALADPYRAFASAVNGLAGPLHGLAGQEVLTWLGKLRQAVGDRPSQEAVRGYIDDTLASGRVVPGYGHAVLRKTDPRFEVQREFAQKHLPDSPLVRLVDSVYQSAPEALAATGKVSNPYPNVDAHSGAILHSLSFTNERMYTAFFAASRSLGALSHFVIARALLLPIERPKSFTSSSLEERAKSP